MGDLFLKGFETLHHMIRMDPHQQQVGMTQREARDADGENTADTDLGAISSVLLQTHTSALSPQPFVPPRNTPLKVREYI